MRGLLRADKTSRTHLVVVVIEVVVVVVVVVR